MQHKAHMWNDLREKKQSVSCHKVFLFSLFLLLIYCNQLLSCASVKRCRAYVDLCVYVDKCKTKLPGHMHATVNLRLVAPTKLHKKAKFTQWKAKKWSLNVHWLLEAPPANSSSNVTSIEQLALETVSVSCKSRFLLHKSAVELRHLLVCLKQYSVHDVNDMCTDTNETQFYCA